MSHAGPVDGSRSARPAFTETLVHGAVLGVASLLTFVLVTDGLSALHDLPRSDDELGGMWAVVATVFVYRASYADSVAQALARMAATLVSFALCLAYLLVFPFTPWGLAAVIAVGAVVISVLGGPEDVVTTGITSAVVLVVADLAPRDAWLQPPLRLVDTVAGVLVGLVAARLTLAATRSAVGSRRPVRAEGGE